MSNILEEPMVFHWWSELIPEMADEVRSWMSPVTKVMFARTCKKEATKFTKTHKPVEFYQLVAWCLREIQPGLLFSEVLEPFGDQEKNWPSVFPHYTDRLVKALGESGGETTAFYHDHRMERCFYSYLRIHHNLDSNQNHIHSRPIPFFSGLIKGGHFKVFRKYIFQLARDWEDQDKHKLSKYYPFADIIEIAGAYGRTDWIEWIASKYSTSVPWVHMMYKVIRKGRLDTLLWMEKNHKHPRIDFFLSSPSPYVDDQPGQESNDQCEYVARFIEEALIMKMPIDRRLQCLDYLIGRFGSKLPKSLQVHRGIYKAVITISSFYPVLRPTSKVYKFMTNTKKNEVDTRLFDWCYKHLRITSMEQLDNGNIEFYRSLPIVKWFAEHGFFTQDTSMDKAVMIGSLEVVKYLHLDCHFPLPVIKNPEWFLTEYDVVDLSVFEWLCEIGHIQLPPLCAYSSDKELKYYGALVHSSTTMTMKERCLDILLKYQPLVIPLQVDWVYNQFKIRFSHHYDRPFFEPFLAKLTTHRTSLEQTITDMGGLSAKAGQDFS